MNTKDKDAVELVRTSITLPADVREAIQAKANASDRSLSREITRACRTYLDAQKAAA